MYYLKLTILFIILISGTVYSQNVGGFNPGEITPQEAKPYDLKSGVISGNVNLFDGSYNYSQPLANISTPSGLSYGVQISYNSTNQTGNNPSHLSGVPYGEGWNIAIPNIRISTGVYHKYGDCGVNFSTGETVELDRAEALKEGQLYWMAPVLNIPGVVSGRMIYKYSDNNGPIFVMHEFDKYVEARFSGSYWEVKLWDGTIWEFKQQQISHRNAVDQRVNLDSIGVSSGDSVLQNLTIPKIDAVAFYATKVYNPNHPAGNKLIFEYNVYGIFNFHKEHLQSNVINGYKFLDLTFNASTNSWHLANSNSSASNVVLQFTGFKSVRDFFLKGIYAYSTGNLMYEKVELDYKTFEFNNGVNLPKISDTGVARHDSLYNISSVYKMNNSNSGFSNWKRYRHWRSDPVVSTEINGGTNNLPYMQRDNPYVGISNFDFDNQLRMFEAPVNSNSSGIQFDHSFLESPKIMGGSNYTSNDYIVPGDLYELKTRILNNNSGFDKFCNFDINIITGSNYNNFISDGFGGKDYYEFSKERTQTIFSTFNKSIKWNHILTGIGLSDMTTSNIFTMPNLPMHEFNGFHIQVGPANSDQMFTADHSGNPQTNYLDITVDDGIEFVQTESTYFNENPNLTDGSTLNQFRSGDPIKNNFGIGYPWHMVKPLYEKSIGIVEDIDINNLYSKWWNHPNDVSTGWQNEPTMANSNVYLNEVELLRYSKNTYLLHKVKHYKLNGEYIISAGKLTGEGVRLISEFEFDYDLKTSETKRDFCAEFSPCSYQAVSGKKNIVNLKSIVQNPIKNIENLNPIYTLFEYGTLQNPFQPYTTQLTKPNGNIENVNISTAMMGSSHLNVLKQITNKLGGKTQIEYYEFNHPNTTYEFTYSDKNNRPFCNVSANSSTSPNQFRPSNNLAFSLKPAVKKIKIEEDGYYNIWDYVYEGKSHKGFSNYWQLWNNHLDGVIGLGQSGFTKTIVYEPFLDNNHPTKRVYSIYEHYTDSIQDWHLFGKQKSIQQFDVDDKILSESKSKYKVTKAYINGRHRNYNHTLNDYNDFIYNSASPLFTNSYVNSRLELFSYINPILFAESEELSAFENLNNRFLNSYFIKKSKDITSYYEYISTTPNNNIYEAMSTIDQILLNTQSENNEIDYSLAIDSNLLDSTDIVFINNFTSILQSSYLKYTKDSLELSWVKKSRSQRDSYKTIKIPFKNEQMASIVDKDLAASIFIKLQDTTKELLYQAYLADKVAQKNINEQDFFASQQSDTLKIDIITDYDYWDADYKGETNSNGYEILNHINSSNNSNSSIQLLNEPSWQLFSKTTYSPQVPETYDRQEYYYFYDLHNNLGTSFLNKHVQYKIAEKFGLRNLVYEVDNIRKSVNTAPVIKYQFLDYWDEWLTEATYSPNYKEQIYFSSESLDNVPDMLLDAGYFSNQIEVENENLYNDSLSLYNDSIADYNALISNPYAYYGCVPIPKAVLMGWEPISPPPGFYYYTNDTSSKYYCPDSLSQIFSMPPDPFADLNLGKSIEIDYIPVSNFVELEQSNIGIYPQHDIAYLNDAIVSQETNSSSSSSSSLLKSISTTEDSISNDLPYWTLNLGKLHLKRAFINIDTLKPISYQDTAITILQTNIANDHAITRWHIAPAERISSYLHAPIYFPIKPYDVKRLFTIEERNNFGQPKLVVDEKGLISRYSFHQRSQRKLYKDTLTGLRYESIISNHIGLPKSIVVGVGLIDSLSSFYSYTPENNIASIIDPNGMEASYTYDDFSRLKSSYLNGKKLDLNRYNYWNGDTSLSFQEIALQNFSEKYIFFDPLLTIGNKIRNYVDPTGKDFGSISQSFNGNSVDWHKNILNSGKVVRDKWGRPIKSYKAFETNIQDSLQRYIPHANTDSTIYPQEFLQTIYESNQRSRPIKTADFGVPLNSTHTISNQYQLIRGQQAAIELELSAYEKALLFDSKISDFVLKRTRTIDQDGKINFEYSDVFDRKIALKQVLSSNNFLVTLFVYDALSNVTKVINPKKQESTYEYNLEGLLYRKTTPDDGTTKYRYNMAKQVAIQQDEKQRSSNWMENKYRAYKYDAFGRLIEQYSYGVDSNMTIHDRLISGNSKYDGTPINKIMELSLYYDDIVFPNGHKIEFNYVNTYNDIESFSVDKTYVFQPGAGIYIKKNILRNHFNIIDSNSIRLEKRFEYNMADTTDLSIHNNARIFVSNSSENLKGKVARSIAYDNNGQPIQYSFFSYNNEGSLKWEMKQFNPNSIIATDQGMLYRIDYKNYDYQGNLLTKNIDINSDFTLDAQYHYTYDEWNRLSESYFNMNDSKAAGNKIASFHYDNASGKILKTNYYKKLGALDIVVDSILYNYDTRERLTNINSTLFEWAMYYDAQNLSNVTNSNNYNGNINATKASYKLNGYTNLQSMFDKPTNYGYTYDNINRLVQADAYLDTSNVDIGDVSYSYDVIGNLLQLNRHTPGAIAPEEFTYQLENGTNRLLAVHSNMPNSNRAYTYDANGNLLSDSYKQLNHANYGRANLPVQLQLANGTHSHYLFDEADDRLFKNNIDSLGISNNKEYYLKDASGKTLSVYDYNSQKFEWFTFGANRTARSLPSNAQQPLITNSHDATSEYYHKSMQIADSTLDTRSKQLKATLLEFKTKNYGYPDELLKVQYTDGSQELILSKNFDDKLVQFPNLDYDIVYSSYIKDEKQSINLSKDLVNQSNIALDERQKEYSMSIAQLLSDSVWFEDHSNDSIKLSSKPTNLIIPADWVQKPNNYDPYTDSSYTELADTVLHNLIFYVYDHLGNTRVTYQPIVNPLDSTIDYYIKGVFDYYPYGKILRKYEFENEKYLTTQHERDTETGFDYRGARFYDADVARFLSVDPWATKYPQWSTYNYVISNPIVFVDHTGKGPNNTYTIDNMIGDIGGGGGGGGGAITPEMINSAMISLGILMAAEKIRPQEHGDIVKPGDGWITSIGDPFHWNIKPNNGIDPDNPNPKTKVGVALLITLGLLDAYIGQKSEWDSVYEMVSNKFSKSENSDLAFDEIEVTGIEKDCYSDNVFNVDLTIKHKITKGQTLSSISKKYGITVDSLKKMNNISDANEDTIYEGNMIIISKTTVEVSKKDNK